MQKVITVSNVNFALPAGLAYLACAGNAEDTRNGPAMVAPGPVATVYTHPRNRVLFSPLRDANPFFHLIEALWILAGRNDVKPLAMFNKRMVDYSDDGKTFHGAYGYRLRRYQGFDQIVRAVEILRANPNSRQTVLQIWDAASDLGAASKDIPCNDMVFLRMRNTLSEGSVLDLSVANRSNDVIWGAYGANAVQFAFLQEYIAAHLGCGIGRYTQISHNYHVYTATPYWQAFLDSSLSDTYAETERYFNTTTHLPMLGVGEHATDIDEDLRVFFSVMSVCDTVHEFSTELVEFDRTMGFSTSFFRDVVHPMVVAYSTRDTNYLNLRIDWHLAGQEWVERRKVAAALKEKAL